MRLNAELDAGQAENMLTDFMGDADMEETSPKKQIQDRTEGTLALANVPNASAPPSSMQPLSDCSVDRQVEAFRKQAEEKEKKMREKRLQKEAEKEEQKKKRDAEKKAEKDARDQHKASATGKAQDFLKHIEKDKKRAEELAVATGTVGMKAGFAREWRTTFQNFVKKFGQHEIRMNEILDGANTETVDKLFKAGMQTADSSKLDVKGFNVAKGVLKKH